MSDCDELVGSITGDDGVGLRGLVTFIFSIHILSKDCSVFVLSRFDTLSKQRSVNLGYIPIVFGDRRKPLISLKSTITLLLK